MILSQIHVHIPFHCRLPQAEGNARFANDGNRAQSQKNEDLSISDEITAMVSFVVFVF